MPGLSRLTLPIGLQGLTGVLPLTPHHSSMGRIRTGLPVHLRGACSPILHHRYAIDLPRHGYLGPLQLEPKARIELAFPPYQGGVLPLNYNGIGPFVFGSCPGPSGALEEVRTLTSRLEALRATINTTSAYGGSGGPRSPTCGVTVQRAAHLHHRPWRQRRESNSVLSGCSRYPNH